MRVSMGLWSLFLCSLTLACGRIKSEKPESIREVSVDEDFKRSAELRLKQLDSRILELQGELNIETNNRQALEQELKETMFLRSWESIRTIQPCGANYPDLMLHIGKRLAYSFSVVQLVSTTEPFNPGPLNPGEYYFKGHKECPFRIEFGRENLDGIGQSALNLTTGEIEVLRVCWTAVADKDSSRMVCSSVLGDKNP